MTTQDIYNRDILSKLHIEPEGLTRNQLFRGWASDEWEAVARSIDWLLARGRLIEVRRMHAEAPTLDHWRLVVLGRRVS